MLGFKGTWIWPLNPRVMDSKTSPSTLYTLQNRAKEEEEKSKQEDGEQEWIEHITTERFININSTIKATIIGLSKDQLSIM